MRRDADRRCREGALRFLQNIAARSADPFYICDPSDRLRFVFVNEAACRFLGRRRKEMLALTLPEIDVKLSREDWQALWEEAQASGSLFIETTLRHGRGDEFPVAVSVEPLAREGREFLGGCIHDLGSFRASEEAMRESEEMLRTVFNGARDAMVVHTASGKIIDVNEPFLRLHGVTREEALSLTIADLSGASPIEEASPFWERVLRGEQALFHWSSRRYCDGTPFEAEIYLTPIRLKGEKAILANVRDLTEQQKTEQALHQAHELLKGITEGTQDLIAATDPKRHFIAFNSAFRRTVRSLFGTDPQIGGGVGDAVADLPEDQKKVLSLWERALQGETFTITEEFGDPERGRRIFEIRYSPLRDAEGRFLGAAHIGRDVTERVRTAQALAEAKRAAEAANEAKSAFLANISHELRTPLSVIMGALELLAAGEPSPAQQPLLGLAEGAGQRLLGIIEDLLDLTRIETGRLRVVSKPFSLRTCLRQLLEIFALPARSKGVELRGEVAPQVPEAVVGDRDRIDQILLNLVGNALKFTEHGRVTVRIEAEGEDVVFSVCDTGIGIPADKLQQMFEPFTQADVSSTRRFGGVGLGLAICRDLVALMGGELSARSEEGAGSVFSFRLPLPRVETSRSGGGLGESAGGAGHGEDCAVNRKRSGVSTTRPSSRKQRS